MFGGIRVHRFIGTAVHGKISLPVAIQVQGAQSYSTGNRVLEDAGLNACAFVHSKAWQPDIQRNQFHSSPFIACGSVDMIPIPFPLRCAHRENDANTVCSNPLPFYKIEGLLPSVDSRKQVPSDSQLTSDYENP